MAMAIRETFGSEGLQVEWNVQEALSAPLNVAENMTGDTIHPDSLMVDIEGIHVGPTRNYTWYTEQALKSSVPTWTKPYMKPLIMHHNEKDGRIIGRVRFASYTDKNTRSGTGALLFTTNVPDKDGKEQIQDGRLKTVSIGATVHECSCSICGHDIANLGECEEHQRGGIYEGKRCYWMIYSMEAKELSYVIVPSDQYAHNVRIYKPQKSDLQVAANFDSKGVLSVSEATKLDPLTGLPVSEAKVIDENGDNQPAAPTTPTEPSANVADLQKEIETLKAEKADLKVKAEALEADKKKSDDALAAASKELNDTKVLLDQAQKSVISTQALLTVKESELAGQIQLRESLESQIIQVNTEMKNSVVENIQILRSSLGKPAIVKEDLEKRSDESLRDALLDLKEEAGNIGNHVNVSSITPAANPGLVESQEPTTVKETKKVGNIDLKEGLEDIMSSMFRGRN